MRIVSKIFAGILLGVIAGIVISPLAAVFVEAGYSNIVFLVTFLVVFAAAVFAPTGKRAGDIDLRPSVLGLAALYNCSFRTDH